jgi:hypothetical protein
MRLLTCSALLWLGLAAIGGPVGSTALARAERFALIIGNNRGLPSEVELRYAESDARKVHDTLRDIGGFQPFNMVLLESANAETLRRSLIDLNARLRSVRSQPNTQAVLFVYYSGHADVTDLHLGDSRLAVAELSQLVRGSAADFRLLVLDACRSGVLTRSKGGHITQPFDIPQPIELSGEGLAFLTASAQREVAQESDELRGSFFTHAFVSGLLGAADRDRDGNVVLDEAYQYAYDNTLRASSRSASGLQHPTFFYDLRGQGQLVLTRPFAPGQHRGILALPKAATYLVFRGSGDGQVMAEVSAADPVRELSLPPGTYFVRGRTPSHVLEGDAIVSPAQTTRIDPDALTRVEYAHLVRKGYGTLPSTHSVELLGHARSALPNASTPCFGAFAGYRIDLPLFSWLVRAGACTSRREAVGAALSSHTSEIDIGLRALRAFDLSTRLSLDAGAGLGAAYFEQRFDTEGKAPTRRSGAGFGELVLGMSLELGHDGAYMTLDSALQAYVLPMFDAATRRTEARAALTGRVALGCGMRF